MIGTTVFPIHGGLKAHYKHLPSETVYLLLCAGIQGFIVEIG